MSIPRSILKDLLTLTVNNFLQTLNNVKSNQYFVVKQKFNTIHIMCANFKTIPWVLCNYSLFNLKGQIRKSQKLEFSLHYSEVILISFVMLNYGKRHFVIRNA